MGRDKSWPKVWFRPDRGKWEVDLGKVQGKRQRILFDHESQALKFAELKRRERLERGTAALVDLDPLQKVDAVRALRLLSGKASLEEAAVAWVEREREIARAAGVTEKELKEAVSEFCREKKELGQRDKSVKSRESRLETFVNDFGEINVGEIQAEDLKDWLSMVRKVGPVTWNNYLTELNGFFRWCERQGYVDGNPVLGVPRKKVEKGRPVFLSVEDCAKLMAEVRMEKKAIAYFSLCLFAGIRPAEAERLSLPGAMPDGKHIRVEGDEVKGYSPRVIEAKPVLLEWLSLAEKGSVHMSRRIFDQVRKNAGVPWANDILRHTFATYHVAMWQNVNQTVLEMGHRDSKMLFAHYRGLTTKKEAERFWGLMPEMFSRGGAKVQS